jgi:Domain of unknown function (DUF4260)
MSALALHINRPTDQPSAASPSAEPGTATGGVRLLLRLEGVGVFAAAVALYGHTGLSWPAFVLFLLAPDLSMAAYLAGPRAGAVGYNIAHTYVLALGLTLAGFFAAVPVATAAGLIWTAHIGFDRALGYGLKYATAFGDTHLARIGRR